VIARVALRVASDLPAAAAALREASRAHAVTAIPTDTFYGLAVDPRDPIAVKRVYTLKGRPADHALLVVGASFAELEELVLVSDEWRARLAGAWPAPLTVVLAARERWPAGGATLAVRVPAHELLRRLLARVGPLTATSANLSGEPPPESADAVADAFSAGIALVVDGGTTPGGAPSTLLDCTAAEARMLRYGAWRPPEDWPVKPA
jgi:L-threonylcarbamoyladenylate synthase